MRLLLTLGRRLGLALFLVVFADARIAGADSIQLAWDPSPDVVSGYIVYVGSQSGTYSVIYDVGNNLAFTLPTVIAGQPYYFAVASYTPGPRIGSLSPEVVGYSNMPPTLENPGNQVSQQGQAVSLQLAGSDPAGQPVSFSANGLPPGLQIASSGAISGTGTTAGTYAVTATVSDGTLTASAPFTWTVTAVTALPLQPPSSTTVQPAPPPPDISAPHLAIKTPSTTGTYAASVSPLTITGTASDNVGIVSVMWTIDRGGTEIAVGTAAGTTAWSATVPLSNGQNRVTITARDAAGNLATKALTVQYKAGGSGSGKS